MPYELIIFLLAIIPIGLRAWMGWRFGATSEIRYLLAGLFASLVALRYWYQATTAVSEWITINPPVMAAGVFAVLFFAAWMLAALIFDIKGEVYQSVLPNPLDNVLGVLSGLVSGALMGGSLLLFLTIALPGKLENFDPDKFPVRLNLLPIEAFRQIENRVAGVPLKSLGRTPLAQWSTPDDPAKDHASLVWK